MSTVQSSRTFCAELKALGIDIPKCAVEIYINLPRDEDATICFKVMDIASESVTVVKGKLPTKISSMDFYNKLSKGARLPEHTTSLSIAAGIDEIVTMHIEAALPVGSLGFLKELA
jgi:hypothetical protein